MLLPSRTLNPYSDLMTGDERVLQLLHWDGQAWNPYTYRWNDSQTDADLVEASHRG